MHHSWARKALVFSLFVVGAAAASARTLPWTVVKLPFARGGRARAVPQANSATLRMSPQDTYLNLDSVNYSTATTLATYTWPDAKVANAIVMKFDLSALPAGASIQEATLHMSLVQSDAVGDTYAVTAHKITGKAPVISQATGMNAATNTPWTANTCCSNNTPLAQADISSPYDTELLNTTAGPKAWTITRLVQEWVTDPTTNRGMLLNSDATKPRDRYRIFASMENANTSLRPYLDISYVAADVTPPTVKISTPASGATLSSSASIAATASDNVGVAGVRLLIDGKQIGSEVTVPPYGVTLDTTTVPDGTHTISATARDAAGNSASAPGVSVTVLNGMVVLSPQDTYLNIDTNTHNTEATLGLYTWPDDEVANAVLMKFDLSSIPAGVFINEATLNLALVQSDSATGTYSVRAQKVLGVNPDISKATGLTYDGKSNWTANACCANNMPLAQADLSTPYDTESVSATNGWNTWTITSLVKEWIADPSTNFGMVLNADATKPRDRFRLFASTRNTNAALRPYLRVTYSLTDNSGGGSGGGGDVKNPKDVTPPSVSITSPSANASVAGVVSVLANASDDTGVVGVQFRLDGANLGTEITAAPYGVTWDTSSASTGQHSLTAVARDAAGNTQISSIVAVSIARDTTAPSVSITAPSPRLTTSGVVSLKANASDNIGVAGVQFQVDGVNVGAEDVTAPYSVQWNSATVSNGSHTVRAIARDDAGNTSTSAGVAIRTSNDLTPPTVSVSSPTSGSTVSSTVTLRANASDNVGVAGVQFRVDGVNVGSEDTSSPYTASWNASSASLGAHSITAVARDAAGNTTTSGAINVTVGTPTPIDSTPPVISGLSFSNVTTSNATVNWTTNEASDSQVEWGLTTVYGNMTTLASSMVTSHTTPLGGLSAATTYHARVRSKDATGNLAISGDASFTTSANPPSGGGTGNGIASQYPGDVNIESNPDVVFVERFDESSMTNLFSRWNDVLNGSAMSIGTDAPSGGNGKSLTIPWTGGGVNNGGHLYRQLSTPVTDTLYIRYYIKYPTSGLYQHSGIWMGGHNPAVTYPDPQAGLKPAGNDRFSAAAEQDGATGKFDHYDYWTGMHISSDGNYWGNELLNNPSVTATAGQWMCVEQMVKLNNPVSSSNGEHAIWLNGTKVSDVGQGFPTGTWSGGNFIQGSGSAFPGFQWRTDTNLNINWLWLQVYAPRDPAGFQGQMKFAQVVAAKSYIGCMSGGAPVGGGGGGDTTAPTVSVSAPAASATVSGSVSVTATASDNVGVSGVQFKLDGANLGSEDTASPYSVSWDTTSASNGTHVLTAVARDAAGNTTTSASRTVSVSNNTGGGGGGGGTGTGSAIFESNWDTATGGGNTAVTDGGRWPNYWEFDSHDPSVTLMSVVSGGPNGHNALRVQQRGSNFAANVQINDVVPQSKDYYLRFYMKNDDTSGSGDHIATVDTWNYPNLTFIRKSSNASGWQIFSSLYGCGYTYPIGHWSPNMSLAHGQWYRFEYFVHFVDATHIQLHPRIYDQNDNLILSDADIRQSDYGSATWNGRSDWTFASYYAAGNSFCVDPQWVNDIGLGNNGQQGATDTGQYWYFAALQVRTDGWAGPVAVKAPAPAPEAAPAPDTISIEQESVNRTSSSKSPVDTSDRDVPFASASVAGLDFVRRRRSLKMRRLLSRNPSVR